jgi:hypothetical protein
MVVGERCLVPRKNRNRFEKEWGYAVVAGLKGAA